MKAIVAHGAGDFSLEGGRMRLDLFPERPPR
jgi:hypothetical protein